MTLDEYNDEYNKQELELKIKGLESEDEWTQLNGAAKANLSHLGDLAEFYQYRDRLRKDGHSWSDAFCILSGFIWDCLESYTDE